MGRMVERKIVFLDTHAVIWLFQGKKIFGQKSLELMNKSDLRISPMVRLELMMLFKKGRIVHPFQILNSLKQSFYFKEDRIDFSFLITESLKQGFTNDPFDRIISAHAAARKSKLITKDREILENFKDAVW